VIAAAMTALNKMSGVAGGVAWGGYTSAERCRLIVGHPELIATLEAAPAAAEEVAAVEVSPFYL
jgi:hypothetical protein